MRLPHILIFILKGVIKKMLSNNTLDVIMIKCRISNVLLSKITNIHVTTISRYRNNQRNIGKKSFYKIYDGLIQLEVNSNIIREFKKVYENSRYKKVL